MLGGFSALCLFWGLCGFTLGCGLLFPAVGTLSAFFGVFFGGVLDLEDDPDLVPLVVPLVVLASSFPLGVLEPLTSVLDEL